MDFGNIEIIVSEIDGIITDGRSAMDYMNHVIFKTYCERDFEAINKLKSFFSFVFLSNKPEVSYNIMRSRNIPAYFADRQQEKSSVLINRILPKYNARPENLLYVGNTLTDIPCMQLAEIGLAVEGSSRQVLNASNGVIPVASGHGVITNLCDTLFEHAIRKK